jgi:hypothetical protein
MKFGLNHVSIHQDTDRDGCIDYRCLRVIRSEPIEAALATMNPAAYWTHRIPNDYLCIEKCSAPRRDATVATPKVCRKQMNPETHSATAHKMETARVIISLYFLILM